MDLMSYLTDYVCDECTVQWHVRVADCVDPVIVGHACGHFLHGLIRELPVRADDPTIRVYVESVP